MLHLLSWALILLLLPGAMAIPTDTLSDDDLFNMMVVTIVTLFVLLSTMLLLGRWNRALHPALLQMHLADAETQTGDTTVSRRLREEIELWKVGTLEAQSVAMESRKALDLAVNYSGELMYRADHILRRCLREMDEHRLECPLRCGIHISRHGKRLHVDPRCSSLEGRDRRNVDLYDPCALCSTRILPPDLITVAGGTSLRMAINTWLEADGLRTEESH